MKTRVFLSVSVFLAASLASVACGPTPRPVGPTVDGGVGSDVPQVTQETREGFREAVARFMDVRRTGRPWTREQCASIADEFEEVSEDSSGGLAEAVYDRGVVFQQCGMHDEAKEAFAAALQMRPDYPAALIQLGVYEMLGNNVSGAEDLFTRAFGIDIAAYEAYINLGIIAASRGNFRPGQAAAAQGSSALPADTQIGNALAIQADSVVALENLARFYFDYSNQAEANSRFRRFALLICTYAIQKNPNYAPIYNLRGLIALKEENIRGAIGDFQKARALDPDFYEAHMNYAALNLGFRGYEQAYEAYQQGLRVRPDSYDALNGIGVAIRGLASEAESSEDGYEAASAGSAYTYEAALQKYEAAKQLDGTRPEAYLNIALLYHGFLNDGSIGQCERAVSAYETALQRAQGFRGAADSGVDYAAMLTLTNQRLERARKDCETIRQLQAMEVQAAEVERQMQEAERLQREEEERLRREQESRQPPPPPPEGGGETPPAPAPATP